MVKQCHSIQLKAVQTVITVLQQLLWAFRSIVVPRQAAHYRAQTIQNASSSSDSSDGVDFL